MCNLWVVTPSGCLALASCQSWNLNLAYRWQKWDDDPKRLLRSIHYAELIPISFSFTAIYLSVRLLVMKVKMERVKNDSIVAGSKLLDHFSQMVVVRNETFSIFLTVTFFCIGLIGILNHEMWRDELQAWSVARDSASVSELLFKNMRYEGHPSFWYLCLYAITRLTSNPVAMQFFHLSIATSSVFIFTRYSPFTKLQKGLFPFGYFPLFEYGILSRNYALGVLLIFLFCALFHLRDKSYFPLVVILSLLANTSVYGLILACALGATMLFECVLDRKLLKALMNRKWDLIISILVFSGVAIITILQMNPPPDRGWGTAWTASSLSRAVATPSVLWNSYFPIPFPSYQFWNTSIIEFHSKAETALVRDFLAIALFIFSVGIFVRKPVSLFLYLSGTFGILLFTDIKWFGFLRHHGFLFILLIACLWISQYFNTLNLSRQSLLKLSRLTERYKENFITIILSAQLCAGLFAFSMDLIYPFSDSREAANFIKDNHLEKAIVVGSKDYLVSPLSGYLNIKIYYPEISDFGTYWHTNNHKKTYSHQQILDLISDKFTSRSNENRSVLMVLSSDLGTNSSNLDIEELGKFNQSFLYSNNFFWDLEAEHYYLYLVKRKDR